MVFYQLMKYQDDLDLNNKLAEREVFYNFVRPHSAMNSKISYEWLLEK